MAENERERLTKAALALCAQLREENYTPQEAALLLLHAQAMLFASNSAKPLDDRYFEAYQTLFTSVVTAYRKAYVEVTEQKETLQ